MGDLQRKHSDVLDYVIEDCRSLSLGGRKHVEVSVTQNQFTNYDKNDPVSFTVKLTYETKRFDSGLEHYPIVRPEMVANLSLDDKLRGVIENPGYRTREEGIPYEVHMQVIARLASLVALKSAGLVGKVLYRPHQNKPFAEVTPNVLAALSGGASIPAEKHQLSDDFAA